MKKIENLETTVGTVSLHIENGGAWISVENSRFGPKLVIGASHFGHKTNEMGLFLHPDALRDLAELFQKAADYEYSQPYCIAIGQHHKKCCGGGECQGHSTKEVLTFEPIEFEKPKQEESDE